MNCNQCGTPNEIGRENCIKCGSSLNNANTTSNINSINSNPPITNTPNNINSISSDALENLINASPDLNTPPVATPTPDGAQNLNSINTNASKNTNLKYNYLRGYINILRTPYTAIDDDEVELGNQKISLTLALISTIAMTIANFIGEILTAIRVRTVHGYTWDLNELKTLNYFNITIKSYLLYVILIAGIAGGYYLASLIIKRSMNIYKFVSIAALAITPYVITSFIAPILGILWMPMRVVTTVIGMVYFVIIIYELINKEFSFEGNDKIYFNSICLGIIGILAYFVYITIMLY